MQGKGRRVDRRERVGPYGVTKVVDHVVVANWRSPADEWRLIEASALFRDRVSITEIGARFGVSRQRAQVLLEQAGVRDRPTGRSSR